MFDQLVQNLVRAAGIRYMLWQERRATGVAFNPLAARLREDPYPAYRALRERDPVHRSELMRAWLLTRYDDCAALLRDPRFSAVRSLAFRNTQPERQLEDLETFFGTLGRTILFRDPPDHTRLRNLVNKAFTPRSIELLRPRIQEIVDGIFEQAEASGRLDAVRDLANPLPVIVIAEMLGIPREDRERFKRWSDIVAEGLEPVFDPAVIERTNRASTEIVDYFRGIVAARRAEPREDLVSRLVAARDEGDHLSESEVLAFCLLLLVAGNETTTNLIGNGLLALMRNPAQLRRLCDDPSLTESAVEELLRYDSPVQLTGRVALEDVELHGRRIEQNQMVVPLLGSANRDPAQFAAPDQLDIGRQDNRHLSFGLGIHFCLGAPLARAEAQIVFRTIAERFSGIRLYGPPVRRRTMTLRGLDSLPVRL